VPNVRLCFSPFFPSMLTLSRSSSADILTARDPRRNQPLVDYLTTLKIDEESSEAFNVSKKADRRSDFLLFLAALRAHITSFTVVGTAMKALGWHFTPWAPKYIEVSGLFPVEGVRTDSVSRTDVLEQHRPPLPRSSRSR
jgi:proteasome activator subunit 4